MSAVYRAGDGGWNGATLDTAPRPFRILTYGAAYALALPIGWEEKD